MDLRAIFNVVSQDASDRLKLWSYVIQHAGCTTCAEVGVYEGQFAEYMLRECDKIQNYYMLDPWRHLDEWNKPLNRSDDQFIQVKARALSKTEFAAKRRTILQGLTSEVADGIPDHSLDFAYIDGDHTLRGITIDLNRLWPKVRDGGILAGDDFCRSVWQHSGRFEPTLVFPYAVYFAEAMDVPIYALPGNQFAIHVDRTQHTRFEFCDLTGKYNATSLRAAMSHTHRPSLIQRAKGRIAAVLAKSP